MKNDSLSIYLSFYQFIYLSFNPSFRLSRSLSICLFNFLLINPSFCPFIYLYIYIFISIYLSFYLSIYLSINPTFCLSIFISIYLFIFLSINLFIYLFIYISIYQSFFLSYLSIFLFYPVLGLDVNVKFTGVQHFEYTPEMLIFDILNMNLYHGWLVDPQNKAGLESLSIYLYICHLSIYLPTVGRPTD